MVKEALALEEKLGLRFIRHARKKPDVGTDITEHFGISAADKRVVVIGDRIVPDVVMGNAFGYLTVFTRALSAKNENTMVSSLRKAELRLASLLKDESPPKHPLAEGELSAFLKADAK